MSGFDDREVHLRQRAARDWTEDQDVRVCIEEIDRLRAWREPEGRPFVLMLPGTLSGPEVTKVLVEVLREEERIRRQRA